MAPSPSPIDRFRQAYEEGPAWEIGHVQPALAAVADRIRGSVLDVGCGTGDAALYFAARGHDVYGIDFVPEVIAQAQSKAAAHRLDVCFLALDALALKELPRQFDNVLDSGLFHVLSDDDRSAYIAALHYVLKPNGRLWLLCWSDQEPPKPGPRRVSRRELQDAFADGWTIESLEDARMEAAPHVASTQFTEGGPRAYRLVARRD